MTDTLIKLCGLYENTSQRTGRRYFTGYLGAAKVLMLEVSEAEREEGKPTWTLFIAERPDKAAATTASERAPPPVNRAGSRPQPSTPASGSERPFDDSIPS